MSALCEPATHWTEASIESVASVEFGTRVTKRVDAGTRYPVYGGGGATFSMDEYNREDCYIVSRFGMSEECVRRVDGKFFLNDSGLTVRTRDEDRLSQRFLDIYLLGSQSRIFELGRGAAQKNLNVEAFRQLSVPLPSLEEQKRIVAMLDQAFTALDRARANAKANRRDAGEVFDRKLEEVFSGDHPGWKVKRLDEVCAINSPLVDPRQSIYIEAIHVGAGNIESRTGRLVELKTSREEGLVSGKFPFNESMVLYSKIRPYLEKVARPQFSGICSADMYPLEPIKGQITRDFLFWLLLSKPFTKYAIEGSARAGMPKVNRDHLFKYETVLPAIDEQERIGANLDALRAEVSELQSQYENELADLAALRQSLLQAACAGQLT